MTECAPSIHRSIHLSVDIGGSSQGECVCRMRERQSWELGNWGAGRGEDPRRVQSRTAGDWTLPVASSQSRGAASGIFAPVIVGVGYGVGVDLFGCGRTSSVQGQQGAGGQRQVMVPGRGRRVRWAVGGGRGPSLEGMDMDGGTRGCACTQAGARVRPGTGGPLHHAMAARGEPKSSCSRCIDGFPFRADRRRHVTRHVLGAAWTSWTATECWKPAARVRARARGGSLRARWQAWTLSLEGNGARRQASGSGCEPARGGRRRQRPGRAWAWA
ncbi:hypothetical protein C8Q80DRAFT_605319 [Daedaleopsis nitida]|nr:hypothetical protein C8Q80DRAFT_605319 [Daedaleopsis nitida]